MECRSNGVCYPTHSEWVVPRGAGATSLGVCSRCGEITDLRVCVLSSRQGYGRSTVALVAAGLATPPKFVVEVTERRNGKRKTRAAAEYGDRREAEDRARDEGRPLTATERAAGWQSCTAVVVDVPAQMLGRAAAIGV